MQTVINHVETLSSDKEGGLKAFKQGNSVSSDYIDR